MRSRYEIPLFSFFYSGGEYMRLLVARALLCGYLVAALPSAVTVASAAPVTIENAGFETPVIEPGAGFIQFGEEPDHKWVTTINPPSDGLWNIDMNPNPY